MTPQLTYEQTFLFYEAPQVIAFSDTLGLRYIGFLIEDGTDDLVYVVAPLSFHAYHAVAAGRMTYWEGLQASKDFDVFTVAAVGHDLGRLEVREAHRFADVDQEFWPDESAARFVRQDDGNSLALEYAKTGPVLVELALDPTNTGVPIGRFSALLARLQLLLRALAGEGLGNRQLLNIAVPTQAGSLKVLLQQSSDLGTLFPNPDLRRALEVASDLIRASHNRSYLQTYFSTHAHAAAPFKELVRAVKSLDTGIALKWETTDSEPSGATATRHEIQLLSGWLESRSDPEATEVAYRGVFSAMDLKTGTWRLSDARAVSSSDLPEASVEVQGKTVKGSGDPLRHLVSGGEYTFDCLELLTLDALTTEPQVERTLIRVREVA